MWQQAVRLNARLLTLPRLSLATRLGVMFQEVAAAIVLLLHGTAVIRANGSRIGVRSISELGTVIASVVDVYDALSATSLLDSGGSPLIIDIGANIGQFGWAARLWIPHCRLVSVEPDPATFERLSVNIRPGPSVTLIEAAVGDAPGSKPLYRHPLSILSSLAPFGDGYSRFNVVPVSVLRLDDILASESSPIDLLKVDVEGYEGEVMLGAATTLQRTRYLLFEMSLGRDVRHHNLEILGHIKSMAPRSSILKFGRPLGGKRPACQDVLISLDSL